ncbi:hypothetical protein Tco_1277562 [Tanacetum coccineum]
MEKMLLAQVQEAGITLSKEQLAILADTGDRVDSLLGSDVLSEVPHSQTYQNDMDNQSVQAMPYFKQKPVAAYPDNEITSDSNIILYSQYLLETQHVAIQDTNLSAQQDSMILYVIEHMFEQMIIM